MVDPCVKHRVTTCPEKLEMSGNFTDLREMSRISVKIRELLGGKILSEKIAYKLSLSFLNTSSVISNSSSTSSSKTFEIVYS